MAWGMAQRVEHMSTEFEALNLDPSIVRKKK
jgi:hypothetical protein